MTRETTFKQIPPVPVLDGPALTNFLVAVKQRLEVYQGNLGTGSDVILRSKSADLGEFNVNADWDAISGDAKILNKPTLGSSKWTDAGTYVYPNNWSGLKIYDSGRLDMASSQWVYDDDSISYTGIGCGQIHRYNQLIKNFTMNNAEDQVLLRVEGKSSGGHDALALMTAIQLTGTGQGWGSNPMIDIESTWQPTSGKWAVGCEIDLNLRSNTPNGLTQGLMIVGVSTYAPLVAQTISMGGADWKDGIWMSDISNNGIIFLSNPAPSIGIRFDYPCSSGDILHANGGMTSWKDTSGASRIGCQLDTSNDWHLCNCGRYVTLGQNATDANPVHIRVNGVDNCQLIRSPDTDSAGKNYVTFV